MNSVNDFLKARYWRAVIIGATTTPDNSWRIFLIIAVNVLAVILFSGIAISETDSSHWRFYAAWGIALLSIIVLPLNIISALSYWKRHSIDLQDIDPKFRKIPDFGKEFRIAVIVVLVGPPIVRYVFGLFGVDIE